uniref:EF-hand domain-containing protein n=1 Tax=Vannella robusta TaxID=1487602 RepID=A0A7S4MJZ3_9EUKA|mmetsp:Transcript_24405/g.31036  ORF Transcript_24405/g.31036 Transcript_24405/m.31036 type:complete len:167 (+) Transcript_24405:56-556(+)
MATPAMRRAFQEARTEFKELSIQELKDYEALFVKYDTGKDGFLDQMELKYMMEKLGHPQTHLGLKAMIKEVDEDLDNMISYKEFLLIFRYAKSGQLKCEGLKAIAGSVNVDEVGVGGAKNFFETKAKAIADNPAERDRAYHEQQKAERQKKAANKAAFKERAAMFQ